MGNSLNNSLQTNIPNIVNEIIEMNNATELIRPNSFAAATEFSLSPTLTLRLVPVSTAHSNPITSQEKFQKSDMIYTRYLYIYQEAKCSLLFAILDKNREEALFWAYEIYYSGFQVQLIQFIIKIYTDFYSELNPKLGIFLEKKKDEWINSPHFDWTIGTMIINMIIRPFCARRFFEKAQNIIGTLVEPTTSSVKSKNIKERPIYIHLEEKDVEQYMNRLAGEIAPNEVLKTYAKYAVRKNECSLFNMIYDTVEIPETKRYREMWLYYASFSPIWQERINQYNGARNVTEKTIDFVDDVDLEAFYLAYGYEPDEQPMSVQSKSMGTGTDTGTDLGTDQKNPMTWSIFWEKYGNK
jgi:hypothetical protein